VFVVNNPNSEFQKVLVNLFPDAIYQQDITDPEAVGFLKELVKIFDFGIDYFRNPLFYENPQVNSLFTDLWLKISNKQGYFVALDISIQKMLVGIGKDKRNNYVRIFKLPPNLKDYFDANPTVFLGEILYLGKLLEGYDILISDPNVKIANLDNLIKPYIKIAYQSEVDFLNFAQVKYEIDLSHRVNYVNEMLASYK
jgi:hypothetical protein